MDFQLSKSYIQLNQLLKQLNIAQSGGEAKIMVQDGMLKVNEETEYRVRRKLYKGVIHYGKGQRADKNIFAKPR
jgi:ribosome-associated protein